MKALLAKPLRKYRVPVAVTPAGQPSIQRRARHTGAPSITRFRLQQPPSGTRQGVANTAWLRWAKSISATVLAMLIVADVGANAAHNAGAVVSRIVPIMHDQPFYFDPLAIVHDVEKVIH